MGGSALLIHGELEPSRREVPRSWLGRLLGAPAVQDVPTGPGRQFHEFAPGALEGLARDFRDFLARELQPPWPATQAMFDYLGMDVTTVYLRGERDGDAPATYYVQLSFSGCAGMAQTSAELAGHWAQAWFERERARIEAQWLAPRGFVATGTEIVAGEQRYLPIGRAGYAGYFTEPQADGSDGAPVHFVVDDAVTEADEDGTVRLLDVLERRFAATMRDGRCRCQLCAPDFDLAQIADLPQFD